MADVRAASPKKLGETPSVTQVKAPTVHFSKEDTKANPE
jgi:hypothetical protein